MTTYYLLRAIDWLNPLVHLVGGLIAFRTFLRCRKNGYLVVAFYFFLATFTLAVMPSIRRAMAERRVPDVSEEIEKKMHAAMMEAADKVLEEAGHPPQVATMNINFPLGPILLVTGLWMIAKTEHVYNKDNVPNPTGPVR